MACKCEKPNTSTFSFHKFPHETELRQKWITKVRRKNNEKTNQVQEPNKYSFVCSLHFKESDYRVIINGGKRKERPDGELLQRKELHPGSIPSIFPDLPEYFNKPPPEKRSESTSKESRFKKQFDAVELASAEFLAEDNISSLEQLEEKLCKEENLPKDILHVRRENKLTIYYFKENEVGRPIIKYSLIITEDLQFSMWCNEVKVPHATVKGLYKDNKVNTLSGVLNILTRLKNMSKESEKVATPEITIKYCSDLLTEITPDLEEETGKKVVFLTEQLQLLIVHKNARRYSSNILCIAVLWDCTSPALFRQIWSYQLKSPVI